MSNQQRDKKAQTQKVNRERDATMAPTVTQAIHQNLSQENHNITEKSTTSGSLQINDYELSGLFKNVSEMKETDALVDASRMYLHETVLNEVKNEETIITNEESIDDHTLQLTNSGGQTGGVITSTKKEEFFSKRLTKYDVSRGNGGGLKLPVDQVKNKILLHISAPADGGEGEPLTLVDHEREKWNMLFVLKSQKYYLRGSWYNYVEKYKLKNSDTIIIEKITISKEQVKEEVDFAAANKIGDHDWDTIFAKDVVECNADQQIDVKSEVDVVECNADQQIDVKAEVDVIECNADQQIDVKSEGDVVECNADQQIDVKAEAHVEVEYEIKIERGPGNTAAEQEDDTSED